MTLSEFIFSRYPGFSLPKPALRFRKAGMAIEVYDRLRKKYVRLTPEELVRQCFISYLIENLSYPASLMANEIGITLNGTKKRCDTIIYGHTGNPLMLIEYKSPDVNLSQEVFDQIARYSVPTDAHYLTVSNGIQHFCCWLEDTESQPLFLDHIPDYKDLKQ